MGRAREESLTAVLTALARRTRRAVLARYGSFCGYSPTGPDEWAIGIARGTVASFVSRYDAAAVRWLTAPDDRFYADPFVVVHGSTAYLFFEEYLRRERRGRIVVVETTDFERFTAPRVVLEQPFHLSYPCVFVHEERYYCVPEQHQSREVALYEARPFPDRWVKRATLITAFAGVDPTIVEHAGRWWMFVTNRFHDDASHLYVFYADRPEGPWRAHRRNPVRSAARRVRPAGRPFLLDGALVRPAQDCSSTYGGRVELQRIEVLTRTHFEERCIGALAAQPQWPFPAGLHTVGLAGDVVVFDAKRRTLSRNGLTQAIRRRLALARS